MAGACGGAPAPTATGPSATKPAISRSSGFDVSPVAEPPGLVLVGRVRKPDDLVKTAGAWAQLPLPSGADLVRSVADDAVAAIVDTSRPIDVAVTLETSRRSISPLAAFSVTVNSYEEAKAKLGARHRLVERANGEFLVEGVGRGGDSQSSSREETDDDEDDDEDGCVLAPAADGARLVCGEPAALDALVGYLSRTVPKHEWNSDVHVEVRPAPVRAPLREIRSSLPVLARSLLGQQSPSLRALVEASLDEVSDIVEDAQSITIDALAKDSGIVASTRFEFQSNKSLFARLLTTDRVSPAPDAFWRLPKETDVAFFGSGSDPKLFERPRELIASVLVEALESEGMPTSEINTLKELVADRMFQLFASGAAVYGKGFDLDAVEKAAARAKSVKDGDQKATAAAEQALLEQAVGWHLYHVNEPIANVGPLLKDWSTLWTRPSFVKWARGKVSSPDALSRLRVTPVPRGITLPNGSVHLEIVVPRVERHEAPTVPSGGRSSTAKKASTATSKTVKPPVVVHVFAVPDGASTWLAFGLDAKLVASRAAESLASAAETKRFGESPGTDAFREKAMSGGGIATLRGLLFFNAIGGETSSKPFARLGALPHGGKAPLVFTGGTAAPSSSASAGAAVGTLHVTRPFIEDVLKFVLSSNSQP